MKLKHAYDLELLLALLAKVEEEAKCRPGDQSVTAEIVTDAEENFGLTFTHEGNSWVNATFKTAFNNTDGSYHLDIQQGHYDQIVARCDYTTVGCINRAEFMQLFGDAAAYIVSKLLYKPEWVVDEITNDK